MITVLLNRQAHFDKIALERGVYYANRKVAMDDPSKYLSIIIDGMDQVLQKFVTTVKPTILLG